jgi:hypothetical protein
MNGMLEAPTSQPVKAVDAGNTKSIQERKTLCGSFLLGSGCNRTPGHLTSVLVVRDCVRRSETGVASPSRMAISSS